LNECGNHGGNAEFLGGSPPDYSTSSDNSSNEGAGACERQPKLKWEVRFQQLQEYKQVHGDCNVPKTYPVNQSLAMWVVTQRQEYKKRGKGQKSSMTDERKKKLESMGFEWVLQQNCPHQTWEERYQQLQEYKLEHGDCNVPNPYPANQSLAGWVLAQRQEYRKRGKGQKSSMTEERKNKLESMGFERVLQQHRPHQTWEERYQQLQEYKREHGDCNVSKTYPVNRSLAWWVTDQRREYKKRGKGQKSSMTDERKKKLESMGFEWVLRQNCPHQTWEVSFQQLLDYKQVHGDFRVSLSYPQNPSLGWWVGKQCQFYRKGELKRDRMIS
jgi:Fe2+ transport system protein FeoA